MKMSSNGKLRRKDKSGQIKAVAQAETKLD
jgi:hypothetical protein